MNGFNRTLLVLSALVIMIGCGAVIAASLGWLPTQNLGGTAWFHDRLAPFAQLTGPTQVEALIVASGILLLAILLLMFEVVTLVPSGGPITIRRAGLGSVTVDDDVVKELARREASQVQGVIAFQPQVGQARSGLLISGRLAVRPDANLAEVSQQVQDRIKAAVEQSLTLQVQDVRLRCTRGVVRQPARSEPARQRGGLPVQVNSNGIIERLGPVTAGMLAALAIIVGILVIIYPQLLAWAVGIALILLGVAVFVAILTRQPRPQTQQQ